MRTPIPFRTALAALGALGLLACSPVRPALSGDPADAETLAVKEKRFVLFSGERLAFGEYAVDGVIRDTAQEVERSRDSGISVALREDYAFRISGRATPGWTGICHSDARRRDEIPLLGPLREKEFSAALRCELAIAGRSAPGPAWKLVLQEEAASGRGLKGWLTDGSETLMVTGSKPGGREAGHSGYEIAGDDGVVAAVVVTGADEVLFRPAASGPLQPVLAAAAAALLLYVDADERLTEIAEARLRRPI